MAEKVESEKLSLSDYDAFGFDLDHTIARYNLVALFKLTYVSLAQFLVNDKGYSEKLLDDFEAYQDFLTRGIIFDKDKGNFLKLNENGHILRASHGTTFMSVEEIKGIYGSDRKWDHTNEIVETVNNADTYFIFENFFDMTGMLVIARLVDVVDEKAGKRLKKYNIWKDFVAALNNMYRPQAFAEDVGGYFPNIKQDIEQFVTKRNEDVITWLKNLRKDDKKVFLLTTSFVDYASHVCQQTLGDDWESYFDIICTNAKKPGFFDKKRQFLRVENLKEMEPIRKLEANNIYSQGNVQELMKVLRKMTGKESPKVCFFGDSLRSDIFPSKKFAGWETVLILEEMEIEGMDGVDSKMKERTIEVDIVNDDEPTVKKRKTHMLPSREEALFLGSSKWGSFFIDNSLPCVVNADNMKMKHMNTFWGFLIRKYADIAVPQLEYISDFSLNHKYEVFDHEDEKKSGFYPGMPKPLKK